MNIGNTRLYFINANKLKPSDCNYYAAYEHGSYGVIYLGVFTKEDLIKEVGKIPQQEYHYIYAYTRKTISTRGKTGQYQAIVYSQGCLLKVTRYADKYLAKYCNRSYIANGYKVEIFDLVTGEIIACWNKEE